MDDTKMLYYIAFIRFLNKMGFINVLHVQYLKPTGHTQMKFTHYWKIFMAASITI